MAILGYSKALWTTVICLLLDPPPKTAVAIGKSIHKELRFLAEGTQLGKARLTALSRF
jgi:hypothetical protein